MKLLVTCRDKESFFRTYVPAIRFGGWEDAIEVLTPGDFLQSWEGISGLLLSGGADIHPRNWDVNEPLHPKAEVDEERDTLEMPLVIEAWERKLPILGICRGEQVLNVALGGSLVQDIPDYYGCDLQVHSFGDNKTPVLRHFVRVESNSHLEKILGYSNVNVNSRHHQAVGRVASALRPVAWCDETQLDGQPLIEAVEAMDSSRWVLGVQWHPENLISLEGESGIAVRELFKAFAVKLKEL